MADHLVKVNVCAGGIKNFGGEVLSIGSITDGQYLKRDGSSIVSAEAGGGFTSKVKVYLSANQSIPTATWTKVQLNTEVYDADGEFDNSVNYRFTATEAGYYLVIAVTAIAMSSDVGKVQWAAIKKNGTTPYASAMNAKNPTSDSPSPKVLINDVINLEVDDYIELDVYHNAGANRDLVGAADSTYMIIFRIA